MKSLGAAIGCFAAVVLVVLLTFAIVIWGGGLNILQTQINRQVIVQSQQYITAHNDQILGLMTDYASTNDPSRQQSIVHQVCQLASEITGNVTPAAQPFVLAHC